eukprot:3941117-Rhodomonas_salina.1
MAAPYSVSVQARSTFPYASTTHAGSSIPYVSTPFPAAPSPRSSARTCRIGSARRRPGTRIRVSRLRQPPRTGATTAINTSTAPINGSTAVIGSTRRRHGTQKGGRVSRPAIG